MEWSDGWQGLHQNQRTVAGTCTQVAPGPGPDGIAEHRLFSRSSPGLLAVAANRAPDQDARYRLARASQDVARSLVDSRAADPRSSESANGLP